jgi:hypothetical protein
MIKLQEDYNEIERQDEVACVSSSVTINKIGSTKEETVNISQALNEFLTDSRCKYTDTAETSDYVSHKMPTNGITHSKCDDNRAQEEEVNRDDKKTTVTERDAENVEKPIEMSVHVGNEEDVSKCSTAGQIERYVNCSLELQLINQGETQSNV